MYHKPHIGLVDSHAKGNGGHYHVDILLDEGILVVRACLAVHARMIGQRFDVIHPQQLGQFFNLFPAQTIYNSRFTLVGFDEADNIAVDILCFSAHLIIEVRAVKRGFEHPCIGHGQILLDVVLHLGGGRGGERNDGSCAYHVDNGTDATVFRAEIMSPL